MIYTSKQIEKKLRDLENRLCCAQNSGGGGGSATTDASLLTSGILPDARLSPNVAFQSDLAGKQATLVSGTNIKTINGNSLLGGGNLVVTGAVTSVFGRTGVVVATTNDYTADQINETLTRFFLHQNATNTLTGTSSKLVISKTGIAQVSDSPLFVDAGASQYVGEFVTSSDYAGFLVKSTNAIGSPFVQFNNSANSKFWTQILNTDNSFSIKEGGAGGADRFAIAVGGWVGLGAAASSSTFLSLGAATTANSTLRIPSGTAPTSPVNGDVWQATNHLYARLNGVSYQLDQQSISLGPIGSTPNANAATLTGTVLNLEPANTSFGGIITTGVQSIAGAKTFTGDMVVQKNSPVIRLDYNTTSATIEFYSSSAGVAGTIAANNTYDIVMWTAGNGSSNPFLFAKQTNNSVGIKNASPLSILDVGGAIATPVAAKSTNYSLLNTDSFIFATSSPTVTLPTATTCPGRTYVIKNAGTGTVTINTTSSQTIDGDLTYILNVQYAFIGVTSDGANWQITA